jgi:hypothetical protein
MTMLARLLDLRAPLHLVLCLRKEWYADLVAEFTAPEPLDRATFHLQALDRASADDVMRRAPMQVNMAEIAEAQREEIWAALQEDGTVAPASLSIVCHEFIASGRQSGTLRDSGGVEALLQQYLQRALRRFADAADRFEALDMLGMIAGTGDTRSFVTKDQLESAPLREGGRRHRLLLELEQTFLIKGDSPRRGFPKVYDIMHERLLQPLRDIVAAEPGLIEFREAADRLVRTDAGRHDLSWRYCRALIVARGHIAWDARSAGILLASLIANEQLLRGDLASLFPHDADRKSALRTFLCLLADNTALRPDVRQASTPRARADDGWWMSWGEIIDAIEQPTNSLTDELALQSLLRAPAALTRDRLRQLAARLSGADGNTGGPLRAEREEPR